MSPGHVSRHPTESIEFLRKPVRDVVPIRVVVACLFQHVESSESPGIGADSSGIGPVSPVRGRTVVDQAVFEPPRTPAPVDVEILAEKTGHHLSSSVRHESGFTEFAHVRIDERYSRGPRSP